MKRLYLIIIIALFGIQVNLFAQNGGVSIGKGDVDADPSAILELFSTNKGLLIPRLSSGQREGISSPAAGLLVYDTTFTGFYYWTGISWKAISGISSSSGTTLPGSGGEGDLFYNTTEGALYTYVGNIWRPVGSSKQILNLDNTTLKLLEEGKEGGSEVDLSALLQELSLDGTKLSISDGNSVDLGIITGAGQTLSLNGTILTITNGNSVNFASLLGGDMKKSVYDTNDNNSVDNAEKVNGFTVGTSVPAGAVFSDSQTLSVSGSTLAITGGNSVTLPSGGTDDQTAGEVSYSNSTSGLAAENVQSAIDEIASSGSTDDQQITDFSLSGSSLNLTLEDGGSETVDLSSLAGAGGTDDQQVTDFSLSGNILTLTLEDGGTNTVDLSVYLDNTDDQDLAEVLSNGTSAGGSLITNLGTPTATTDAATKGYVDNSVSGLEDQTNKNIAGGYVGLESDGKIDQSYLPSGITLGTVYTVADQPSQDALSPVSGDVAIRTDESKTYVYDGTSWQELQNPTGAVTSVSGRTGVVTLTKTDVGLNNVDNTSDVNKPVSSATQSALDLKANTSDLGTASGEDVGTGAGNIVQLDGSGRLPAVDGSQLTGLPTAPVNSVNGQVGVVTLSKGDVGLNNVDNTSDSDKPVSTATQTALNLKEDKTNKNQPDGYVGLEADGKINANYLPAGVTLGTVYTAADAAAASALTLNSGDVVVRTDESKTYIYDGSSLVELQNPTDAVTSVNGQTGVVSLSTAEVAESADKNYVTDAEKTLLGNTSGSNTGDQDVSGIATNATNIAANATAISTKANSADLAPVATSGSYNDLSDQPIISDDQTAGEVSYSNSTSGLAAENVQSAIDEIASSGSTDDQQITDFSLSGSSLNLTLEDGGSETVDLSSLAGAGGTDDQQVTDFSLSGNILTLTLEDGGTNTVDLSVYLDNTDDQDLAEVLSNGTSAGGSLITNLGTPTATTDAATKGYVDNSVSGLEDQTNKNIAGGYVGLESDGKIDQSYLPSGITLGTVYTVADQPSQDALSPVSGDVAIRTDESKTYVYDGTSWQELQNPTGAVTSVSGRTGVVTLTKTDVGLNNVDNTSDVNKPVSSATQSALDLKANTSDLGTASGEDVGTGAGNIVQLDGSGRLPAVDGSQLTGLPTAPVNSVNGQVGVVTLSKGDVGLNNVDNTSDSDKPVSTATQTALNLKEDKTNKNQPDGYVGLEADGKINANYLPAGVTLGTVYTAADAAAASALTLNSGDVVVRTDESKTYIYDGSSLVELQNPTDAVTSVNGQTGVVSLSTAEVAESADKNYVTDAEKTLLGNTSGSNTGDQDVSGIATNATNIAANATAISTKANSADLAPVATSGSYNDLSDQPIISDDQTAGEVSYSNSTSGLAAENVQSAIDEIASSGSTDDQQITDFSLSGSSLNLTLEDGGSETVDLSSLAGAGGTDDQQVTDFSLSGNILTLTLEDGGTNTVDLSVYLDNTDDQDLAEVLSNGTSAGGSLITNLGTPTATTDAATKGYVDNSVSGLEDQTNKNIAGGYVGLESDGKIDQSYLPSGITLGTVYTVADQPSQDALSPVSGDVAIRTDESKTYVYDGTSWQELQNPTGAVTSVSGRTGVVTLTKTDVGLNNVDNTSDVNKPVSSATQSALDLKANTSDLGTASGEDVGTGAGNIVQLDGSGRLPAVDGSQLTGLPTAPVNSVNGQVGVVTLSKGDVGLNNVDNTSDSDKPVSTATQTALNLKEDKTNKNQPDGYVGLEADGKINANYLPAGVTLGTVYTAADAAAASALTLNSGDVVVRTDESKTYIYDGSSLVELQNPTDAVTSVNGQTGVVSLSTAEVAESADKNYVTDAEKTLLGNTSGSNTGDQDVSGIATNATNIAANATAISTKANSADLAPVATSGSYNDLSDQPIISDDQTAGEVSYSNSTSGLAAENVQSAIDEIASSGSTDDQQITDFSLSGSSLNLTLEDGGSETVDLSSLAGAGGTDDQQVTDFSLSGNILTLTLEDGGTNTVDLSVYLDNTDDQDLAEVLSNGTSAGGSLITNLGTPTATTDAATKGYVDNSVSGLEDQTNKNIAGGYVGLESDGKIDQSYLPSGITLGTVYTVADQPSQDALSPVSGDVAIRTDESKTYVYDGTSWQELQNPTGAVTSVSGRTGVVTLTKTDVGLNNVDNTSDVNKPVSSATQSALDLKANTSDLGTASGEDVGTGAGNIVQLDGSGRLPAVDGSQLTGLPTAPVNSVNGQVGVVTLSKGDVGLNNVDNTSDSDKPVSTATQTALNLKEDKTNKNQPDGYVGLEADGKINANYLPAGVTLGTVYTAADAAAASALTLNSGDVVVRTDESKTYIYDGSSLVELQNPTDAVTSVNGQTGVVSLSTAEVAESADKNYVTDAEKTLLGNTSGSNTGDQDVSGIATNATNIAANATAISTKANSADLAPVATSGSYNDLSDQPIISDDQTAGEVSYSNSTSGLAAENVQSAIDEIASSGSTDDQQITDFSLSGSSLNLTLEDGGSETVDLSSLAGAGGTDDQQVTDFSLSGNILTLTLEDGGTNTVDLSVYLDNTDDQDLAEVLSNGTSAGGSLITNLGTPTATTDAATKGYVDNSVSGLEDQTNKNIAGGYVGLESDGKIDQSYLPSGITLGTVYTVADQPSQDALSPVSGDVAIRTDESKTYVYDGTSWQELQNPTGAVTSVSGRTGVVTLTKTDVGLNNVDNTSDVNKPVSSATQSALDLKANTSDLGTASGEDVGTGAGNIVQLDGSGRLPAVDGSQLTGLPTAPVNSVNGQVGVVTLSKGDVGLNNVDNTSDSDKPVSTATQTALNLKEDKTNKNQPDGYVGLEADGKINANYLPAGVTLGTVYTAADAAAASALTLNSGDVVVRTDESKTYIYDGSSLVELQNPTDAVTSVNGQTGVVSLSTAEVAESADKNYVTDAEKTLLGNTSGSNTGDQDVSGIATNATNIAANATAISTKANSADLAPVATSGSYNDLSDQPIISDDQTAGEVSYSNSTSGLAAENVQSAIDEIASSGSTDDQQITDFSLSGSSLNLTLEDGGSETVDLSSLAGAGGTDDQQVTDFSLSGNILTLTLEDGGTNTVDLSVYLDNTDDQDLAEVLSNGTSAGGSLITNLGTPTATTDAATKGYVDNSVSGLEDQTNKNIAGGYVGLESDGKIDQSYLPSGITLGTVYTVADQPSQDALSPTSGDVAIRTDESKTYVYDGTSWQELQNPTGAVTSVNGQTGVVSLSKTDVGLNNVDNTSDVNKPVSSATQSALDLKANTSDLGTASGEDVGTGAGNIVQLDGSGRLPAVDGSQLTGLPTAPVNSVNGQVGVVTLSKGDVGLNNVDNTSDSDKPVSTATQTALNLKEDKTNKNQPDGYVGLEADGKINANYLPAGVTLGTVYTAADAAAASALTLNSGDVVVRTDESKTYIYDGSSLVELQNPTDAVTSVNGQTGVVSLSTAEVAESADKNYVTDAEKTLLGNTSGSNTGDQDVSGIATNATNIAANTTAISAKANSADLAPVATSGSYNDLSDQPIISDDQTAGEVSYSNSTSGLAAENVQSAIDEIAASGSTDDQQITDFSLSGSSLNLTLEDGGSETVDLSSLAGSGGTDDQQVTDFSLSGNILTLTLEDGGTNTVDLSVYLDNTDDQDLAEVLSNGTSAGGSLITNLGTPTATTDAATKGYVDNSVSGLEDQTNKNIAGGYVGLESDGKIDQSYLPSGITLGTVYTVADQPSQDALSPVSGDVAIRTDESKTYVYDGTSWQELQNPTGAVTSVSGRTGVVTLTKTDVGLNNVDNTSDVNKPVSSATQSALDLKANTSDLGTASGEDVGTGAGNIVQLDGSGRLPAVDGSQLTGLPTAPVNSVNGQVGVVTLSKGDVGLNNVDNTSDSDKPVSTATQTALNLKEDKTNKNQPDGYVGLEADGKINANYLPAGVTLGTVYTAADAAAASALTLNSGDVVVRTDESKTYIYDGSSLVELQNPTDAVTSVNGQTGVVSLSTAEVAESADKNYVTDAEKTLLGNTSGSNTGDQDVSGIATNATNIAANATAIALKEDLANKSTDVVTDATSDIKYPTVKALKDYVDTEIANVSGTDVSNLATTVALTDSTAQVRSEIPDVTGLATTVALTDSTAQVRSEIPDVTGLATTVALTDSTAQVRSEIPDVTGLATTIALTDSTAQVRSEIPDVTGLATTVALTDSTAQVRSEIPDVTGLATTVALTDSTAQVRSEIPDVTGLATTAALTDSTAQVRSEIPDVTGLATTIALTDSTAQVRSEIPDVTGLATTAALTDSTAQVRSEIPDVTGLATTVALTDSTAQVRSEIPDVTGLATTVALTDSTAQVRSEIPDVTGLATTTALTDSTAQVRSEIPDVTGLATTTALTDSTAQVRSEIPDVTGLATTVALTDSTAQVRSEIPDVTGLATTVALTDSTAQVRSEIPDVTGLATTVALTDSTAQVRSEIPDVTGLATTVALTDSTAQVRSEIPDVTGLATTVALTDSTAQVRSEIPDVTGLATTTALTDSTAQVRSEIPDVTGLATTIALTDSTAQVRSEIPDVTGLATTTALTDSTAQVRSEIPDVTGLATTTALTDSTAQVRSEIPDVTGLATTVALTDSTAQVRSEIPDVTGLATTVALTDSTAQVRSEIPDVTGLATTVALTDSTAQVRSEIPDVTGLATTVALTDSTAQVRSEIPDVTGLATTVALTDSTAQVRSEIPDVTGLATTVALTDSTAQVRSEIPDVTGLATTVALTDSTAQVRSEIPDVTGLATTVALTDSTAQVRSEIPDVTGLATTVALTDSTAQVRSEIPDVTGLATTVALTDSTAQVRSEIPDVTGLATTIALTDSTAQVRSEIPDVTGLATTVALTDSTAQVRSEIPDVTGLATTVALTDSTAQVRSEIPDVTGLATTIALTDSTAQVRSEIPDVTGLATTIALTDSTAQVRSEIPDVTGLATTVALTDSTAQVRSEIPDVTGLATTVALTDSTAQVRSEIPDVTGLATTVALTDSTAQVRSEIPDVTGLATTVALTDSTAQVRSEIPDVTGLATTIALTDSTAQVRSEIPDVTGLATTVALTDSTAQVRSEIPDVTGLATTVALTDSTAQVRSEIPDVTGLATTVALTDSTAQVRSEIPDVTGLATTIALTDSTAQVRSEIPDVTGLATTVALTDSTAQVRSEIPDVTGLATTIALTDSTAQVRSEIPDVTGLATTIALTDSTAQVRSEIPDVTGLATTIALTDSTAQVRSEIPDVTGLATTIALTDSTAQVRSEIPDVTGLATTIALTDSTAQVRSEIPDVTGLATTTALTDSTAQVRSEIPDVTGLATTIALTDSTAQVRSEIPDVTGLATTTALTDSTAQVRSEIPDVTGLATTTALTDSTAQVRSEIPDVTGLATTTALTDSTAQVRSEIPDVTGLATTIALTDSTAQVRSEIPDVTGLATTIALTDSTAQVRLALADSVALLRSQAVVPSDATSTEKGIIQLSGDLTGSASAPEIAIDAVTTSEIQDGTIEAADLAQMSATDGQILKWNSTADSWIVADNDTIQDGTAPDNTLRWDGTSWVESSALTNADTVITVTSVLKVGTPTVSHITIDGGDLAIEDDAEINGDLWVDGTLNTPSDERLKKNITTLTGILDKLNRLRGVTYEFKDQQKYATGQQIGVIAQELQKVFPELVTQGADGYLAVNYSQLSAVILQAVKEQQQEIDVLQRQMKEVMKKLGMR